MNKLYAIFLLTWLFAGCATTSHVTAPPALTEVYIATTNAPTFVAPDRSSTPAGVHFTQNQRVHVLRREKPNWIVVSYEGREVFIPEGFTSPTQVDPATIAKYGTPTAPASSGPAYSAPTYSAPASSTRTINTGPRGGKYYINRNGNKTYIKRK